MAVDNIARALAARALMVAEAGAEARGLKSIKIDDNGDLIVEFNDGTISNLGRVVGLNGKTCLPHIDENNVLTWTIEENVTEEQLPPPLDLTDVGEWGEVTENPESDYYWEKI